MNSRKAQNRMQEKSCCKQNQNQATKKKTTIALQTFILSSQSFEHQFLYSLKKQLQQQQQHQIHSQEKVYHPTLKVFAHRNIRKTPEIVFGATEKKKEEEKYNMYREQLTTFR